MLTGKAIVFGSNIDTDQIIGAHHLVRPTIADMAQFTFEHHPQFVRDFRAGDIIVGRENFGCGSSREQAVAVLQERRVGAVVAISFARIFFRNALNMGLPVITCREAGSIGAGEQLEIDRDRLKVVTTGHHYPLIPLPPFARELFDHGGIIALLRKRDMSELQERA